MSSKDQHNTQPEQSGQELSASAAAADRASRERDLAAMREAGKAYPNDFQRSHWVGQVLEMCKEWDKERVENEGIEVSLAGRLMLRRDMGKSVFATLRDGQGSEIQLYQGNIKSRQSEQQTPHETTLASAHLGDIVGVSGKVFRTRVGELTVEVKTLRVLSPCLQTFSTVKSGVADTDTRYRARYMHLATSKSARQPFAIRSAIMRSMRSFLDGMDYHEVETPMLQTIPGGAVARPFSTHHNALDMELFMRVAPELYLKRLLVGGFDRVYELGRCFRNEGMSPRHNPEFTMLEFYTAYAVSSDALAITLDLLRIACAAVEELGFGDTDAIAELQLPPKMLRMADSVAQALDCSPQDLSDLATLRSHAAQHCDLQADKASEASAGILLNELFEALVEPNLYAYTCIYDYPCEISPFARTKNDNPQIADRFELFIRGRELANGFSELNDPAEQLDRVQGIHARKLLEGVDQPEFDQSYIEALAFGMPPAAGVGVGIDRLTMLLAGVSSIREVLLFPLMKPIEVPRTD